MSTIYAPYRPLTAAEKKADRWGIAAARAALAATRDPFPGITERHAVDQALATTGRGRP